MTKFDWGRKGPPRPGSGSVSRPATVDRPYVHVTEEQKRKRRQELAKEREERGRAIRRAEMDAFFASKGLNWRLALFKPKKSD